MFDPYRKWLGIPPKDQPPSHYRLLSLENFESDPDVIESAAERQMTFIRQYQSGEHATAAAKILNELANARLCLLKPASKARYDAKLRTDLAPPPEPEQDFADLPFGEFETAAKKRSKKSRKTKSAVPAPMLIGGGIAGVVCLGLVVFMFTGKRNPPVNTADVIPASLSSQNTEKPISVPAAPPTTESVVWTDSKLAAEPAGAPIDLLKLVDLDRDRVAGTWQQTATALISSPSSSLYLPVKAPENYQLKFTVRRIEGADSLILGFMMAGRQGMIGFDVGGAVWTGLYVDRREPHDNCTSRKGKLFSNDAAVIVLTVHPGHLHATFDGKMVVDWHGNPERLLLHSSHGLSSRESPFIVISQAKYVFESASLIPIKPEPATARIARLDHEVDVLPLLDTERDSQRGIWGINKNSLFSPDSTGYSQIYLPTIVPEEYTLSLTVEMPPNHPGDNLVVGLVAGSSYFQFCSTNTDIGLDQIDGKRFNNNETRFEGPLLKPGSSVRLDLTVTRNGIRTEVDGKTLIDWRGDVRRLSIPDDWPLADARRLYIGAMRHFKLRDIKLGPPIAPPKLPAHPPLSVGKPLDLLALIDPARDACTGAWERDGNSIRCRGDVQINKLVIPADVPEEYRLTARVARVEGGMSNNDALSVGLPIGRGKASTFIDSYTSRLVIVRSESNVQIVKETGQLIPPGVVKEIVYFIRKTGLQLDCDGKTIIDWKINPAAFSADRDWSAPGPRIALASFAAGFRFEKLELEPLPATDFPKTPPLGADGNLLSIINVERDSRRGNWKLDANGLATPKIQVPRLQLPAPVPERYVLTMDVERVSGNDAFNIGIPMRGHPCLVGLDGIAGTMSGLNLIDGKDVNDPGNVTRRSHKSPLIPAGKRTKIQCRVMPDTIVVLCDDVEVIRWRGDSRRLSTHPIVVVPNVTQEDQAQLWLNCWETEFLIRELRLQPMSDELAAELEGSFAGGLSRSLDR